MAKTCIHDNCKNPVFGGGYCLYHQAYRTDKRRKPIQQVSKKQILRKEDKKKLLAEDFIFYQEIWEQSEHVSFESGQYLGDEPLLTMFHHILIKSKWPEYRHEKWNIVLLTPDEHNQVHFNIDRCPKVKQKTEELLKLHFDSKDLNDGSHPL